MAFNYATLHSEIAAIVEAQWPEVVANGIYLEDELKRKSQGRFTFPFAAIVTRAGEEQDWGLVNTVVGVTAEIHYLRKDEAGLATLWTKLEALKNAMLAATFTSAALLSIAGPDWSGQAPEMALAYDRELPLEGGYLTCNFIAGETTL
jgi:hypothetical protein